MSSDVATMKPDKEIYEIAQKRSGVNSNEILFVDDKPENLVIPDKMGWKTVLFDQFKADDGVSRILELLK